MKKHAAALVLFFVLMTSAYAERNPYHIRLVTGPQTRGIWEHIAAEYPIPGFTETADEADKPAAELTLYTDKFFSDGNPGGKAGTLIKEVWYAPAVDFLSEKTSCTRKEIESGAVPVKLLSAITLPEKAIAVDGLYPGSPGYPLVKRIYLSLQFLKDDPGNQSMEQWFRKIRKNRAAESVPPQIIWIGAAGDIMPGRGAGRILTSGHSGIQTLFHDTLPVIRGQDVMIGNLETTVTDCREKIQKSYNFRIEPGVLEKLAEAGFDFLSITNNHSYDYGETGFIDTLHNLQKMHLATAGAGINLEQASKPWETLIHSCVLRVLSIGAYPQERNGFNGLKQASATDKRPGILWADEQGIEAIRNAFPVSPSGFNILYVHGGHEWENTPRASQKKLYRRFIDAGADIVIGSHPHVLQGAEVYRGKMIVYSLGNFIFPGMEETRYGEQSMLLSFGVVDGNIRYIQFYPVKIDNRTISLDTTGKILKRFLSLSLSLRSEP